MKQSWIASAVIAASALFGEAVHLARPVMTIHADAKSTAISEDARSAPTQEESGSAADAAVCFGNTALVSPAETLRGRYAWAHGLMEQRLYEAALVEQRAIAKSDPGFPGITLDIANSLLQLGRKAEAQETTNAEIAASECLSKLTPKELAAYCRSQFADAGPDVCAAELARIHKASLLQLAVVRLELNRRDEPPVATRAAADVRTSPRELPLR